MARFCTSCGSPMDEAAAFCSKCGKAATGTPPSGDAYIPPAIGSATEGLSDNLAGMLAYLFIPAIVFLVTPPYNRNRYVRFHSFQAIFLVIALVILNALVGILPVIRWTLWELLHFLVLVLWIVLLFKAYQGVKFKVPVVGDMAEKQADAM